MSILETILSHDTVLPMEKLADVTVEEDCCGFTLDLSQHDVSDYLFLVIHYAPAEGNEWGDCPISISGASGSCAQLPFTGSTSTSKSSIIDASFDRPFTVILFTATMKNISVPGIGETSGELYYCRSSTPTRNFTSLTIGVPASTATKIKAGTRATVWSVLRRK